VGALDHLASEHHIFTNLDAAIAHARIHATRTEHAASPPTHQAA
jgi:hypothetical protein